MEKNKSDIFIITL